MKFHTVTIAAVLALTSLSAHAGLSEVTPIGKGRYMIGGRSNTVFGSPGKLQAKAMKVANAFCAEKHGGKEAVLQSADGRRGEQGWGAGGNGFAAGGGGNFAETEIIFTCESPEAATASAT